VRGKDINPKRRGYHSSFVHLNKFYVFGGRDLARGAISSLWASDLQPVFQMTKDDNFIGGLIWTRI